MKTKKFDIFSIFIKGFPNVSLNTIILTQSIAFRLDQLSILKNEIYQQNVVVEKEYNKSKELGYGSSDPYLKLSVLVESYINCIYNILECLAKITLIFYNDSKSISPSFFKQKQALIKNKVGEEYSEFLKTQLWLEKLREIRNEHSHFSSLLTVFEHENGIYKTKFFNNLLNFREREFFLDKNSFLIEIDYVDELEIDMINFLEMYAEIFTKRFDPNKKVIVPRFSNGNIALLELSLNDYYNNTGLLEQ